MQYKYTSLRCYILSGYLRVKLTIYSSTYETVQWIWHVFEVTRSAIRSQVPRWKFVADLQSTPAMEGIFNDFNWFPISSRQTVLWAVSNMDVPKPTDDNNLQWLFQTKQKLTAKRITVSVHLPGRVCVQTTKKDTDKKYSLHCVKMFNICLVWYNNMCCNKSLRN